MDNDHQWDKPPQNYQWRKPPQVDEQHAPDWVGKDALKDFLYWHGTPRNLKRILKFVHGKSRRDTTEIAFWGIDMVRALIDNRSRHVTFFDPRDENFPESVLGFDELADMFDGYIKLGGFPERDSSAEQNPHRGKRHHVRICHDHRGHGRRADVLRPTRVTRMAVHWTLGCDANEPHTLARFWGAALGYVPEPGFEEPGAASIVDPDGVRPAISWLRVAEGKTSKNRLHVDIRVAGEPPWDWSNEPRSSTPR